MDLNKLTQKSQEAMQQAQDLAVERGHQEVDTIHLLSAHRDLTRRQHRRVGLAVPGVAGRRRRGLLEPHVAFLREVVPVAIADLVERLHEQPTAKPGLIAVLQPRQRLQQLATDRLHEVARRFPRTQRTA